MLSQGVCDEDGLQPHVCFCGPGKPKANNNNTCMLVLVSMGPMQMTKHLERTCEPEAHWLNHPPAVDKA